MNGSASWIKWRPAGPEPRVGAGAGCLKLRPRLLITLISLIRFAGHFQDLAAQKLRLIKQDRRIKLLQNAQSRLALASRTRNIVCAQKYSTQQQPAKDVLAQEWRRLKRIQHILTQLPRACGLLRIERTEAQYKSIKYKEAPGPRAKT